MKVIIEVQSTVYYYCLLYLLSLPYHSQYSQRYISQPDCFHHCIKILSWVSSKLPRLHVINLYVQRSDEIILRLQACFLTCSPVDLWDWIILWRCHPVHYRMFSSILGFCPLETYQELPPPQLWLCQVFPICQSQTFFLSMQLIISDDLSVLVFLQGSLLELSTHFSTLDWLLRLIVCAYPGIILA